MRNLKACHQTGRAKLLLSREWTKRSQNRLDGNVAPGAEAGIGGKINGRSDKFGTVNIVVNNAGTNPYFGPIVDSEEWAWEKTMAVNLKAPYLPQITNPPSTCNTAPVVNELASEAK